MINKTVKVLSLASLAATTAFGALPSAQAKDADRDVVFVAAHHEKEKCNPCAAKKCNPCAAEKCNPCAAKKCNPCAAMKCNPCKAKKCNPCAAEKEKKEKK